MFYLISIIKGEGVAKKSIDEFSTRNEALSTLYTSLGDIMKDERCESAIFSVMDSNGMWIENKHYNKNTVSPM